MLPITIRKQTVSEADIPLIQGVINERSLGARQKGALVPKEPWCQATVIRYFFDLFRLSGLFGLFRQSGRLVKR